MTTYALLFLLIGLVLLCLGELQRQRGELARLSTALAAFTATARECLLAAPAVGVLEEEAGPKPTLMDKHRAFSKKAREEREGRQAGR